MSKTITQAQIREIANKEKLAYPLFRTFIEVESSGRGFIGDRIVIQFEPHLFARELNAIGIKNVLVNLGNQRFRVEVQTSEPTIIEGQHAVDITAWTIVNGVQGQTAEWQAFNLAWKIDKDSTMKATSWGLPQILGSNFSIVKNDNGRQRFNNVGDFVTFMRENEYNQVVALAHFIKGNPALYKAFREEDYYNMAYHYNGKGFVAMAARLKTERYDHKLARVHKKYK